MSSVHGYSPELLETLDAAFEGDEFECSYCNEIHTMVPASELVPGAPPNMLVYTCKEELFNAAVEGKNVVGVNPDVEVEEDAFFISKTLLSRTSQIFFKFIPPLRELEEFMRKHMENITEDENGNHIFPEEIREEPTIDVNFSLSELQSYSTILNECIMFLRGEMEKEKAERSKSKTELHQ